MTTPSGSAADPTVAILLDYLGSQRRHILGQVAGLSEEELRRPVLPSQWTILGMLHHLALDVERFWSRQVMAGEQVEQDPSGEEAWSVPADLDAEQVVALYRREAELADAAVRDLDPATPPAWWPDFFGDFRLDDLREVLLHVIVETATHAGHLDVVRELIDGRQWMVLTGD